MKKTIIITMLVVLLVGTVSAGLFDFLKKEPIKETYKPAFNISDTFNTKKLELDKSQVCIKDLNDKNKVTKLEKCEKDKVKYTLIDISNSNYFKTNQDNLVRFNNE